MGERSSDATLHLSLPELYKCLADIRASESVYATNGNTLCSVCWEKCIIATGHKSEHHLEILESPVSVEDNINPRCTKCAVQ